jgi:hypothetical protein
VLKAEWVANRDGNLSDGQRLPCAESGEGQLSRDINAKHCEIRIGVVADERCLASEGVRKRDNDLARAAHHVTVGKNESVRREHKTGTTSLSFATAGLLISRRLRLAYGDVDHRRPDFLGRRGDGPRIRVE